jgi:hypothetical protein
VNANAPSYLQFPSLYACDRTTMQLPLLHEQQVHSEVRQDNERAAIHRQTYAIPPERLDIESETAQNSRPRDFDIKSVFMIDQAEILDLVDNQALKRVVEYGQLSTCR